ncbi:MAG: FtsQ-type POTRA domain-containing protein [Alphaproteobacteria bacterium]|nr:FtsQ-type POTRA domain-containing protein [Alphaproteobacteria bacterium]
MRFFKKKITETIPAQKVDESLKVYLPRLWPYRLLGNILLLGIIGAVSLGIYIVKTNFVSQKLTSVSDYFLEVTTRLGLTVDDVLVFGRSKTPIEEINNVVGLRRGDNIFAPDLQQIRLDLEQLPWVKKAVVERSYLPNVIKINLVERQIQAIWQHQNRFYPIDTEGNVINTEKIPNIPLLLVVGRNAPENLNELLKIIKTNEEIFARVKAVNFISARRWNIILDDLEEGITVKLPANKADKAWKKLLKLSKSRGLLKRKLTIIDLRFSHKVLVTPRKLSAEEFSGLRKSEEHGI